MLTKVFRFLPNAGNYMVNILKGKSNGAEKDRAFGWKAGADIEAARRKLTAKHEWRELVGGAKSLAKL